MNKILYMADLEKYPNLNNVMIDVIPVVNKEVEKPKRKYTKKAKVVKPKPMEAKMVGGEKIESFELNGTRKRAIEGLAFAKKALKQKKALEKTDDYVEMKKSDPDVSSDLDLNTADERPHPCFGLKNNVFLRNAVKNREKEFVNVITSNLLNYYMETCMQL